jgi:hypothetical protein
MAQAEETRSRLAFAHGLDESAIEIVPVTASGDRIQDRPLAEIGGKALWTKELDAWLLAGEIDFAVHSLKAGFPLPRPAATLASVHIVGPLLRAGSFPSGHTAAAMSAALAIAYYSPSKKTAAVALAMALLVSVSRIFVGAHFPMDVVGGMACALGAYVFVRNVIWPRVEEFIPDRPRLWSTQFRMALIAECIATLFAITVYPTRFAESPAFAVTVGIAVLGFLVFGLMQASTRPTL